ncbi:MAG: hypothetical protein FRX48_00771 [Lasallia pustulata]|uniref:Uncharacterized protein n=1 Tax=Lasallia pustulata TaxID=136370 RepID=A0A5M8Q2X2_9LECA|nr:MAG: hypothetical protein FRX48_00771 [Lasallia pustulata]
MTYATINFYTQILDPLKGTPEWVPVLMGSLCVVMVCAGTWAVLGARRIIRTITAIPSSTGPRSRTIHLQLECAPMLPRLKPATVTVSPSELILSSYLYQDEVKRTSSETAEIRRRLAKMKEMEKTHLMTLPFREASFWIWRAFLALKRVFSKEGFIYVQIKGRNGTWKLDQNAAWMLDDGRAIDRLAKRRLL